MYMETERREFVETQFRKRGIELPKEWEMPESETLFSELWDSTESDGVDRSEVEIAAQKLAAEDARKMAVPFRRWSYPKNRAALEAEFDRSYMEYVCPAEPRSGRKDGDLLNRLIDLLGQLTTYKIYARIQGQTVYIAGDEEDITQDGHMGAMKILLQDRQAGIPRNDARKYFMTIYKNKTRDYLRSYGLLKGTKEQEEEESPKRFRPRAADIRSAVSLDGMATSEEGDDLSDRIRALATGFLEDELVSYESMSHLVTTVYLLRLLNNKNVPAAPIAVMYARVLFQLERLMNPQTIESAIAEYAGEKDWKLDMDSDKYISRLTKASEEAQKYTTASSLGWAMNRMKDMTIAELTEDSETSLHINFDPDANLKWGKPLRSQLDQPARDHEPTLWKDLVFVGSYPKNQIEDWVTDVHNSTVTATAKVLYQDEDLLDCVRTVFRGENRLIREIKKQENKEKAKQNKKGTGKEAKA